MYILIMMVMLQEIGFMQTQMVLHMKMAGWHKMVAGIILTHIAAGCIQRECILLMTNATDLKKMVSSSLDGIRQEYI